MEKYDPIKINKYTTIIQNYLNCCASSKEYTHVAMGENFYGKFMLDKNQIKEFTKLYAEAVENGVVFNIAEKPKEYGPLLIDLDLELPLEKHNGKRLYNDDMIYELINTYRTVASKYLNLDAEELTTSVFEKPKPSKKGNIIKDGIHIIFHGITAHYKLRYLIRNDVVNILNNSPHFKSFSNSVDKNIDKAIINTNCWLLPGSRKKDGQLYELKYIYDQYNESINIQKLLSDKYKMINLYSLQHKLRNEKYATEYLDNISFEKIEEQYLKLTEKSKTENKKIINNSDVYSEIKKCLECLNETRYNDYEEWCKIALIINNEIGYNGLELLDLWSQNSESYDKSKVESFYKNIKPKENGLKIGTLKKMAKEDNPKQYKTLFNKNKEKIINEDSVNQSNENYNKIKTEFEKNNFKILNPIMFATIKNNNELILRTKKDFKDVYENLLYMKYNEFYNKMINSSFIDDWLTDPEMRTYEYIDFLPMQQAPQNVYNTFTGYQAEKIELIKTDIENSLMLKHIKNLCNNDETVFDYVIHFLARKIQKPYLLTNTALIFKSNEGAGKDLFFNWFGNKILGSEYYYNTEKPELLFNKFTTSLENKILIIVNETSGNDTFQIKENIK